ncbi:MAG: phosphatase PAP2 family protein [Myxococcota bacterium]
MLWLEAHRHPVLDVLFTGFTLLGVEAFLLFFVALGYWLGPRVVFARAAAMLIVAAFANTLLKGWFRIPRPDVSHVLEAAGWSLPSGHAQVAAALWGWLAVEWVRAGGSRGPARGLWVLAILVSISRPYLGVHYPHDVVLGFLLGAMQVAVAAYLTAPLSEPTLRARVLLVAPVLVLVVGVPLLDASVLDTGVRLLGAGTGLAWGLRYAPLDAAPLSMGRRVALGVLGVLGLLALWMGLKIVFVGVGLGASVLAAGFRYLAVGLWIGVGAPRLLEPRRR